MLFSKNQVDALRIKLKNGKIDRFPKGFHDNIENHKLLLTSFIENECTNSKDVFLKKKANDLKTGGLSGLLCFYGGSLSKMIPAIFGESYAHTWQLSNVPNNFWQGEVGKKNAQLATKWFVEKYYNNCLELLYSIVITDFRKAGLGGMLLIVYKDNPFLAIIDSFGDKLDKWRFKKHPKNYWKSDEGLLVIKDVFFKLCKSKFGEFNCYEDIYNEICSITLKDIVDFDLEKILKHYGNSHHKFICQITLLKIKDYEWSKSSQGTWMKSHLNCLLALKEYFENEKLITNDEILRLRKVDLPQKLKTMIGIKFQGSLIKATMALYPLRFEKWQFHKVPQNYWKSDEGKQKAIDLTRNLIQNKLNFWDSNEIITVTTNDFKSNNLSSIITKVYNGSVYKAIMTAYPGTFNKSDFNIQGKEESKFIRKMLEYFPDFDYHIRKRYPWLRGESGAMLELDLFFPTLNLAFEYQGLQHTVDKSDHFGKNYSYEETKNRDIIKRKLCNKNDVTLIEIPYKKKMLLNYLKKVFLDNSRNDLIKILDSLNVELD